MASGVRVAILSYLDSLPQGDSVQPSTLPEALGLDARKIRPSLAASVKRGETIVLSDGSIILNPNLRGRFPKLREKQKTILLEAFPVLKAAIKKVPAVKYALGLSGIVAAMAIIRTLVTDWRVAVFGLIIMLVLMAVLLLFARLAAISGPHVRAAALSLMWFSLALFCASGILLFTSVFFDQPIGLKRLIDDRIGQASTTTETGLVSQVEVEDAHLIVGDSGKVVQHSLVEHGHQKNLEPIDPLKPEQAIKFFASLSRAVGWHLLWFDTKGRASIVASAPVPVRIVDYPAGDQLMPVDPNDPPGVHALVLVVDTNTPNVGRDALLSKVAAIGKPPDRILPQWAGTPASMGVSRGEGRPIRSPELEPVAYFGHIRDTLPNGYVVLYLVTFRTVH